MGLSGLAHDYVNEYDPAINATKVAELSAVVVDLEVGAMPPCSVLFYSPCFCSCDTPCTWA